MSRARILLIVLFLAVGARAEHGAIPVPTGPVATPRDADSLRFEQLTTSAARQRFAEEWIERLNDMATAPIETTSAEVEISDYLAFSDWLHKQKRDASQAQFSPQSLPRIRTATLSAEDKQKILQLCDIRGAGTPPDVAEALARNADRLPSYSAPEKERLRTLFGGAERAMRPLSPDTIATLGPDLGAARARRQYLAPLRALEGVCRVLAAATEVPTPSPSIRPATVLARIATSYNASREGNLPLLVGTLSLAESTALEHYLTHDSASLAPLPGFTAPQWHQFSAALGRALRERNPVRTVAPSELWTRFRATREGASAQGRDQVQLFYLIDHAASETFPPRAGATVPTPPYAVTQIFPDSWREFLRPEEAERNLREVYRQNNPAAFAAAYQSFQDGVRRRLNELRAKAVALRDTPPAGIPRAAWQRWLESLEEKMEPVTAVLRQPVPTHRFDAAAYGNTVRGWLANPALPADDSFISLQGEDRRREVVGRLDALHALSHEPGLPPAHRDRIRVESQRLERHFSPGRSVASLSSPSADCGTAIALTQLPRAQVDAALRRLNDCDVVTIRACLSADLESASAAYVSDLLDTLRPTETVARARLTEARQRREAHLEAGGDPAALYPLEVEVLRAEATLYASAIGPVTRTRPVPPVAEILGRLAEHERAARAVGNRGQVEPAIQALFVRLPEAVTKENDRRAVPNGPDGIPSGARCAVAGIFAKQYVPGSSEASLMPSEQVRLVASEDALSEELARQRVAAQWLADHPQEAVRIQAELRSQAEALRAEFERAYGHLPEAQRRALAPWLYEADGEYFRQVAELDKDGNWRLAFAPTEKLRRLQRSQALAQGEIRGGVADDLRYWRVRDSLFVLPASGAESQLWWMTYGTKPEEQLRSNQVRSGAMQSSNGDLLLLTPFGALRSAMVLGRGALASGGSLGARATGEVALNAAIAGSIEAVADRFGPVAGTATALAPLIAIALRRPILRAISAPATALREAVAGNALVSAADRAALLRRGVAGVPASSSERVGSVLILNSPAERASAAQSLLRRPLTAEQSLAIESAHAVGAERAGSGVYRYTATELKEKIRLLRAAFPDRDEWKLLLREGVAGRDPVVGLLSSAPKTVQASVELARDFGVNFRQLNPHDMENLILGRGIRPRGTNGSDTALLDTLGYEGSAGYQNSRFIPMTEAHPQFLRDNTNFAIVDTVALRRRGGFVTRDELRAKAARLGDQQRANWVDQQFHTMATGEVRAAEVVGVKLRGVDYSRSDLAALSRRVELYDDVIPLGGDRILLQSSQPYRSWEISVDEFRRMVPEISRNELREATSKFRIYVDPQPPTGGRAQIIHLMEEAPQAARRN